MIVNRESRKEERDWILKVMEQFQGCSVLNTYFDAQRVKISRNQKVEALAGKAQVLMYQYGGTYVCLKGNGRMTLGSQVIDLSKLNGDVALSTASLKEFFVIYLGGFHNTTKRKFLILKKHHSQTKTLTQTDKKRIESLLKKLVEKHKESMTDDDYRNVLQYMLENNCKLEQEALHGEYL